MVSKKFFLILLFSLVSAVSADENFSWLGVYSTATNGGGTKTITVSKSGSGGYKATVKWQGPETKTDVLICDAIVTKDKRTLVLLYNRFDNPYLGTPGIAVADPRDRKTTDDGKEFVKGEQYMTLVRESTETGDVFKPQPEENGKHYTKTSGQ